MKFTNNSLYWGILYLYWGMLLLCFEDFSSQNRFRLLYDKIHNVRKYQGKISLNISGFLDAGNKGSLIRKIDKNYLRRS